MKLIRVLVADDHTILREGLVSILEKSGDCQVVAEASDGIKALELALALRPDVIVLDISMPGLNGIEVVRRLQKEFEASRILVLTMHTEEEYVMHMIRAGASGFLLKDSATAELLKAVRAIADGRGYFGAHAARVLAQQIHKPDVALEDPYRGLTAREREVFHLIVEGLTTKEIARKLEISSKTAENHRSRVLEKLNVRNTAELIRYAVKRGLMD